MTIFHLDRLGTGERSIVFEEGDVKPRELSAGGGNTTEALRTLNPPVVVRYA